MHREALEYATKFDSFELEYEDINQLWLRLSKETGNIAILSGYLEKVLVHDLEISLKYAKPLFELDHEKAIELFASQDDLVNLLFVQVL